jgi:hypothetical protein
MEKYKEVIAASVLAAVSHSAEALETTGTKEAPTEQEVITVIQDSIEHGTMKANEDGSFSFHATNGAELVYRPAEKVVISPTNGEKVAVDPHGVEKVEINPTNGEKIEVNPTVEKVTLDL